MSGVAGTRLLANMEEQSYYGALNTSGGRPGVAEEKEMKTIHNCADHLPHKGGTLTPLDVAHLSTKYQEGGTICSHHHSPSTPSLSNLKGTCDTRGCATTVEGHLKARSEYGSYNIMCPCTEAGKPCQCKRKTEVNALIPTNWKHWPLIKNVLIGLAVAIPVVWAIAYIVLHYYYQSV